MIRHEVKSWPEQFEAVLHGGKRFEVRVNDRGYHVRDILELCEWDPRTKEYTGVKIVCRITYVLQGRFGLPPDVAVLQIEPISKDSDEEAGQSS